MGAEQGPKQFSYCKNVWDTILTSYNQQHNSSYSYAKVNLYSIKPIWQTILLERNLEILKKDIFWQSIFLKNQPLSELHIWYGSNGG